MTPHRSPARGFTMVEAVVVMVITGIVGGMVAVFLKWPVHNYVDSSQRAELSDIADTAVRRMAREIRLAVPNSIRVSADLSAVEFVPSKTGGRYLAAEDGPDGDHLDFVDPDRLTFQIIGPVPTGRQQILANDFIVVNNVGQAPGDVYAGGTQQNRAQVVSVSATGQVRMASNPFALQSPSLAHPMHRFRVATQPLTFRCAGGSLWRYANYGFRATQLPEPTADVQGRTMLAANVESCAFQYARLENAGSGLLSLTVTLRNPGGGDAAIRLTQQVHVDNTP